MKRALFVIMISISICFINCGDDKSPSGLELVNVNMNNGTTIVVTNPVDKLIVGSWECSELNLNDGSGWYDVDDLGLIFIIDFYADHTADGYYIDESFSSNWSSAGNIVTLSILGISSTITNVTSSTFYLVLTEGGQQIDFRFEMY